MSTRGVRFRVAILIAAAALCAGCWPLHRPRLSGPPPPAPSKPAQQPAQQPLPTAPKDATATGEGARNPAPTVPPSQPAQPAQRPAPQPAPAAPSNASGATGTRTPRKTPARTSPAPKPAQPELPTPAAVPVSTPPADEPPPPQLRQILTEAQQREYNQSIEHDLALARSALTSLAGKTLNEEKARALEQARTSLRQAEEARKDDLVSAKNLAERARVLAEDLLKSLR